jgi:hypothetical protein
MAGMSIGAILLTSGTTLPDEPGRQNNGASLIPE